MSINRFAAPGLKEVYLRTYRQLARQLFTGGVAARTLDEVTAALRASGGADGDAQRLRTLIADRTTALANV